MQPSLRLMQHLPQLRPRLQRMQQSLRMKLPRLPAHLLLPHLRPRAASSLMMSLRTPQPVQRVRALALESAQAQAGALLPQAQARNRLRPALATAALLRMRAAPCRLQALLSFR